MTSLEDIIRVHATKGLMVRSKWVHLKTGGTYEVIALGFIEKDMTPCVVYKSGKGHVFVRPIEEFMDGRFKVL